MNEVEALRREYMDVRRSFARGEIDRATYRSRSHVARYALNRAILVEAGKESDVERVLGPMPDAVRQRLTAVTVPDYYQMRMARARGAN